MCNTELVTLGMRSTFKFVKIQWSSCSCWAPGFMWPVQQWGQSALGGCRIAQSEQWLQSSTKQRPSNCLMFGCALFGTMHTREWHKGNMEMSLGCLPIAAQLGEGFAQISVKLVLPMSGSPWYQWHLKWLTVLYLISLIRYKKVWKYQNCPLKNNRSQALTPVPVQVLSESGEWGGKGCFKHRRESWSGEEPTGALCPIHSCCRKGILSMQLFETRARLAGAKCWTNSALTLVKCHGSSQIWACTFFLFDHKPKLLEEIESSDSLFT